MSFSKARIQRFNELGSDVPPPGAYDPKFEIKVRGSVIEKCERFHDNKSMNGAEGLLSVSSKSTGNLSTPFRNPAPPKRKATKSTSASCTKVISKILFDDPKFKYGTDQQLADLKIECANKSKTIQEQVQHIDEMKNELRLLELQLEELRQKQAEVETQHKEDLEKLATLQQDVLNGHQERHKKEIDMLRSQLLEVSEERQREHESRTAMEGDLRGRIAEFSKRVSALEADLAEKKKTGQDKVVFLETRIEQLTLEMEKVNESHKIELDQLEREKAQLTLSISEVESNREQLEAKLEKRQDVILELQAQLSALQCELDELRAEYEKFVEESAVQLIDFNVKHENDITTWKMNYEKEKEMVETLNQRLQEALEELEEADRKHNLSLQKYKDDLHGMKEKHKEEKLKLTQQLDDARHDYLQEIENLTVARDKAVEEIKEASAKKLEEETKRIEERAAKIVKNAEAVTRETLAACRAESEERVKKIIAESDAKMNAMMREARNAVQEDMRLTLERYKSCLARVEMERAALDEKLAQRDAEINNLSVTLEELKSSAETQESFGQSLQMELDRAETELAEKKQELRALKDQIRSEAAEMVARKKRFEVIMTENQESVAALSKRLAQSNAEVERLQHELKRGEEYIHEHRDLLTIMRSNSQVVHEQVRTLMDQLDTKKNLVDQLEADSVSEFESMKLVFEAKIDSLKEVTGNEIARLQEECEKKAAQNAEMKTQLDQMAKSLSHAKEMLLQLESRADDQAIVITRMELQNNKLEEKLRIAEAQTITHQNKVEEDKIALDNAYCLIKDLTLKIERFEDKEQTLEDIIAKHEEEKKRLTDSLAKELEAEKARREALELDCKALTERNKQLLKDHEEISEKYAEILGHQNHRQRIKHVAQLKKENSLLKQKEQQLTRTVEEQKAMIEKLKSEEKRLHGKGKENKLAVPKNVTTPFSSPLKSSTPLRNRNE